MEYFSFRSKFHRLFLCIGIMGCFYAPGKTQLHCINFTSQDGLPAENVLCAAEDQNGFMWFGTSAGVCKFDGTTFIDYSSVGTGPAPGGSYVSAIEIDQNQNLWVGTEKQGIFYFNQKQEKWEQFDSNNTGFHHLMGNEIFFLYSSNNGLIWYGSNNGGLGCIDFENKEHFNYSMKDLPKRNTWINRAYDLKPDPVDSSLLYIVGQGFLYKFDQVNRTFQILEVAGEPTFSGKTIFDPQNIAIASNGDLWLGSWNSGVKSFDLETGTFQDRYPSTHSTSSNWRANVYNGEEDELWIAHRLEGIGRYHQKTGHLDFFTPEPFNRNGLLKGEYNAIYHSSQHQTWVLSSQGISLIVPQHQGFTYYQTDVDRTNFFLDIDLVPGKDMFVGSFAGENGALKLLDSNLSLVATAYTKAPPESFQSIFKTVTYEDKLLCISDRLFEYDFERNELIPHEIPGFQQQGGLNDVIVDNRSIWLLVGNGSLVNYDGSTNKVNEYLFEGYENTQREVVIYHGMDFVGNMIWIATHAELIVFNTITFQFKYFFFTQNQLCERASSGQILAQGGTVHQIVPTNQHCAWVVTSGEGIYLICEEDNLLYSIVTHRDKSNLDQLQSPVKMVHGTHDDYWIATRNGLVHADSMLTQFKVFGQRQGLRNRKLSQGITLVGDQLFIGMPKGFARLETRILDQKQREAKVHIVEAKIDKTELLPGSSQVFAYFENQAVFSVATSIYDEADVVLYAHRMQNYSEEWQYSNAQEKVFRYENLPPGKYRFEVKAKSPGTSWSSIQSRSFTIRPPFWKRAWFSFTTVVICVGLFYLLYQLKLNIDMKESRVQAQIAELENQALRAQMNPHFIFNSLNSIRSLIMLDRKEEGVTYLTKFSRMVREILNHSKEKAIPLEKELELLRIYLDMESLRFHQKFNYQIQIDPNINLYAQKVPPLLIQPFVENSIWHGLMHKDGPAHLIIRLFLSDGFLFIIIEDNGIGREAAAQIKTNKSMYRKSSEGIKLSKSRIDLVSVHAEVIVDDLSEGGYASGTRVTIKLPICYGKKN